MTRGEAVNWIINIAYDIGKAEHRELWHYEQALSEIRDMLQSEPERKKGKWIDDGMHGDFAWEIDGRGSCWHEWICSECGDWNKSATHFCPNCGARMER